MSYRFVSTAIPYVNAPPHIGFAQELVIADVVARHARLRGDYTFFLSGTDDNSLKNAIAAEAAGILLSAGLRPPSEILVHGYVTVEGEKISKSHGRTVSPAEACRRHGTDALRYYLLRHVGSHYDGDFSWERLAEVYEHELANDLGNLVSRATALVRRHGVPAEPGSELASGLEAEVARHVEEFAVHRALDAIWSVVGSANAYVNRTEPWKLGKHGLIGALGDVLGELYAALRRVGEALRPFLPDASSRLLVALDASSPEPLFPR